MSFLSMRKSTLLTGTSSGRASSLGSPENRQTGLLPPEFKPPIGLNGEPAHRYDPFIVKMPIVIGTPLLMFALGIGLEIGLAISNKLGGYKVPRSNAFDAFGNVSAQFLASFFPTLFVMPVAFMWRELDWMLRSYQPYIVLNQGGVTAEESILLDYIELGPLMGLLRAFKFKHHIIFWSSFTAVLTFTFQPLTGSIFQIRQSPELSRGTVASINGIGLSPDVNSLQDFLASAGYANAASFLDLSDPPFVNGGWATAEFELPANRFLNGTLTVTTTGIQTKTNCANPSGPPTLTHSGTVFNLSSKSVEGCVHSVTFDTSVTSLQYGVGPATCPGSDAALDVSLSPVMFWYFHTKADNTPEAKTVFCAPTITGSPILVVANLNDGSVVSVAKTSGDIPKNNVTGGAQAGNAFNGVVFGNSTDPFVQGRANAIRLEIPATVYRSASKQPGGLQPVFDLPNGFMDMTSTVYTRHLSVAAKSIYFVNANSTLDSDITSLAPRLWIDPLPAHALASLLILTGLLGVFLHTANRKQRNRLHLSATPGSIAAITSLTSRSGFGQRLTPWDNESAMKKKLDGLSFRLDQQTGAIIADDYRNRVTVIGADEVKLGLLGQTPQSSSFTPQVHVADRSWEDPGTPPKELK